jgi:chromosome segregation ATPase
MASLKRVRVSSDAAETHTENSTIQDGAPDTRKRRHISDASSESPQASDHDSGEKMPLYLGAPDDEDELELRATQIIQEKYSVRTDDVNAPAENGILERVDCYNFMCHEHFSVELGPLINFIVGKNGSGKSAILTAITLCLGGKASATNRGQSLKSFIKEGKTSATIIVRIKNQGDGAYMPEEYGKSIIVERHFTKNGTSGFKIKSETGRIVSTKKTELDDITDFFSLQIDNPMNVLSQDMARQFLSSSSPAEKYKFFVKGVQLEQLDHDYRLIEESVDQIEQKLGSRQEDIKVLENCKDRATRRLELSDQHESLRERIRGLRRQMAWAQVEEQERVRDSLDNELSKADEKISAAQSDLGQFDVIFQEAEKQYETAAQVLSRATADCERVREDKKEIKARIDEEMNERHDLQAQQRSIREYVKADELRIQDTNQKIMEEDRRLKDLSGGSYARKQEELELKQSEAVEARRRYEEHQNDTNRLHEDVHRAEEEMKSSRGPLVTKRSEIEQAETLLRSMRKEGGAQDAGFHERMPMLLRAIQQEKSFNSLPVGPIGRHVRLLKPEWSAVLETSFGATLSSFIVTSKDDQTILSNIMQGMNCVCSIIIGSEGYIDTRQHEPDPQFDTALRVLEIDNDLVRRQLIINHGIEQMLLIEKLEEASSILFDGNRPRNAKRCYCIDQADRRRGIHLSYSRTGEPSQSPIPAYTGRPRMRTDLDSQIRLQREAVDSLMRGMKDLEHKVAQTQSHLERCKQALDRHRKQEDGLRIKAQRIEDQVEELRDALERDSVREDGRLDALKAALKEGEEELRLHQASFQDGISAMDSIMERLKATRQELSVKDAEIAGLEQQVRAAEVEQAKMLDQRRKIIGDKNAAVARIDGMKLDKTRVEQKREQIGARILDYSEKASLVSSRVNVDKGETTNSLDRKLDRLHKDLRRFNDE